MDEKNYTARLLDLALEISKSDMSRKESFALFHTFMRITIGLGITGGLTRLDFLGLIASNWEAAEACLEKKREEARAKDKSVN